MQPTAEQFEDAVTDCRRSVIDWNKKSSRPTGRRGASAPFKDELKKILVDKKCQTNQDWQKIFHHAAPQLKREYPTMRAKIDEFMAQCKKKPRVVDFLNEMAYKYLQYFEDPAITRPSWYPWKEQVVHAAFRMANNLESFKKYIKRRKSPQKKSKRKAKASKKMIIKPFLKREKPNKVILYLNYFPYARGFHDQSSAHLEIININT